MPRPADRAAWRMYARWAVAVGIAFFVVYPVCNAITAWRGGGFGLYWPAELAIPFLPEWVWVYLSMYVLFVMPPFFLAAPALAMLGRQLVAGTLAAGAIFLAVPTQLGFARAAPADPLYAAIFSGLFAVDLPHNMVPSLHVVFSAAIILAVAAGVRDGRQRWLLWSWLAAICASTLFVRQHHLLDIVVALGMVVVLRQVFTPNALLEKTHD